MLFMHGAVPGQHFEWEGHAMPGPVSWLLAIWPAGRVKDTGCATSLSGASSLPRYHLSNPLLFQNRLQCRMTGRGSNANATAAGNFAAERRRLITLAVCMFIVLQSAPGINSWSGHQSKYIGDSLRSRHPVPERVRSALVGKGLLRVAT